jgi:hypothetical protein
MLTYNLFRIGALLLALCGAMHLFGHFASKGAKPVNGTEFQLEELMYGYKMNIYGSMRTQGDLYDGLSLGFTVFMMTLAALGFVLPVQRKTAIVFALSLAVMTGISATHWFILPTGMLAGALLCYGACAYLQKK